MRILVCGDIHGNYRGLLQILERSKFDNNKDILISLGDIVDGYSQSFECVEQLLKIKNLIAIKGNHDSIFSDFIINNHHPWGLNSHGSLSTLDSYCRNLSKNYSIKTSGIQTHFDNSDIPNTHRDFFLKTQINYYNWKVDEENRNILFVHAGFNRHYSIIDKDFNNEEVLLWDRDFWKSCISYSLLEKEYKDTNKILTKDNFTEIFIGHSPTIRYNSDAEPMNIRNVWNLDTGAGYSRGKLTIIDIKTKEFWQSDFGKDLYPEEKGR